MSSSTSGNEGMRHKAIKAPKRIVKQEEKDENATHHEFFMVRVKPAAEALK
ncbi:MAG TPA: hypothetical protein VIQ97_05420 [Prevotella sp.]